MKTFNITVDYLKHDGGIFSKATYSIRARDAEEAAAIVHNDMALRNEPRFRISEVKEATEEK